MVAKTLFTLFLLHMCGLREYERMNGIVRSLYHLATGAAEVNCHVTGTVSGTDNHHSLTSVAFCVSVNIATPSTHTETAT